MVLYWVSVCLVFFSVCSICVLNCVWVSVLLVWVCVSCVWFVVMFGKCYVISGLMFYVIVYLLLSVDGLLLVDS